MQLKNDFSGHNAIRKTITDYYNDRGVRIKLFLMTDNKECNWHYEHFILDRKHVFRYGIGEDHRLLIAGIDLAIGPHYFAPYDFWDDENSERFSIEASTEAIEKNLKLLDEFLGY